ncbi:hypothetical protein EST38_g8717 [Candolleomyces aberdarensis]|uniref:Uncharacterized protein n=1 Tax=Candolleomyces aberdarensis TaxID=2316362 RepID=A0A4Q2DDK4_9AGAR|nr:hypothetical protein EST38_g8717 [Candolleomyces aberdarensis]
MFKLTSLTIVTVFTTLLAGSTNAIQIVYDNSLCVDRSLTGVSCSNGENGLITKGYTTLGSLPNFPALGGFPGVVWNSTNCGACYELRYAGTGRAIAFTAVNESPVNQAVLCTSKFLELTGLTLPTVPANVQAEIRVVPKSQCGFN